jgi:hypothetical protein
MELCHVKIQLLDLNFIEFSVSKDREGSELPHDSKKHMHSWSKKRKHLS